MSCKTKCECESFTGRSNEEIKQHQLSALKYLSGKRETTIRYMVNFEAGVIEVFDNGKLIDTVKL